jgi:hypothetical protein
VTGFAVVSSFEPVKLIVPRAYDEAVRATRVEEAVTLVLNFVDGAPLIIALNEARRAIGWLHPNDTIISKLTAGGGYGAKVKRIVPGRHGQACDTLFLEVKVPAGALTMPGDEQGDSGGQDQ